MTTRDRVLASLQSHPGILRSATMRVISGKVSSAIAELTPGTEPEEPATAAVPPALNSKALQASDLDVANWPAPSSRTQYDKWKAWIDNCLREYARYCQIDVIMSYGPETVTGQWRRRFYIDDAARGSEAWQPPGPHGDNSVLKTFKPWSLVPTDANTLTLDYIPQTQDTVEKAWSKERGSLEQFLVQYRHKFNVAHDAELSDTGERIVYGQQCSWEYCAYVAQRFVREFAEISAKSSEKMAALYQAFAAWQPAQLARIDEAPKPKRNAGGAGGSAGTLPALYPSPTGDGHGGFTSMADSPVAGGGKLSDYRPRQAGEPGGTPGTVGSGITKAEAAAGAKTKEDAAAMRAAGAAASSAGSLLSGLSGTTWLLIGAAVIAVIFFLPE
jgi:hypothetical protein